MATHTDLPSAEQIALTGNNAYELSLAARAVHRAALDAADERDLLETLGLIPVPPHPQTGKKKRGARPAATADAPNTTTRQEVNP
jgi:hypothetical protein